MVEDLLKELNKGSVNKYSVRIEYMPHSRGGWDRDRPAAYMLMLNDVSCSSYMEKEDMISLLIKTQEFC